MIVIWQSFACRPHAEILSATLHLPLAREPGYDFLNPSSYALYVKEDRLSLVLKHQATFSQLSAEFVKGPLGYRLQHGGGKNQAIARAVGLKKYKKQLTILDVTAGLGKDAFILASLGCQVQLIERSPIIGSLLLDGLQRANAMNVMASIIRSMTVTIADAKDILQNLRKEECPEVVYLDPMFPAKNNSALPKMEMRMIRDIAGDDRDADALLKLALEKAQTRAVVKRPKQAPLLLTQPIPDFRLKGRSGRYDVYLTGGKIDKK